MLRGYRKWPIIGHLLTSCQFLPSRPRTKPQHCNTALHSTTTYYFLIHESYATLSGDKKTAARGRGQLNNCTGPGDFVAAQLSAMGILLHSPLHELPLIMPKIVKHPSNNAISLDHEHMLLSPKNGSSNESLKSLHASMHTKIGAIQNNLLRM